MATITRSFEIADIGPNELAELFGDFDALQQAEFFEALYRQTSGWGGLGWCGQSCEISKHLTDGAREIISTLAGHARDRVAA